MRNFLTRFWPIFAIFILWFIFSSPYFLKGKVPYASTYQVNFFPPWSHYEKLWGPVKNNAMPDVHGQIYPWKKFTIDTYKSGQVAFWNPYSFSGNPHLANFQSAVLSPFNLLFVILPFIDAWSILILLQPLLAGLFTYLFVRAIGVSRVGSLISSITFMFCGFIVVWMAYGTLAYAILYLPLALFAIERYVESRRFRFLLLLSLTVPLSFFSGHFQISLYFFASLIGYIVFKGIVTKKLLITYYLLLITLLGLLLSLPQLLPSIQFYQNSIRSEIFSLSEVIPLEYLITIVAPDFFGNAVTRNDWFGHYAEWASFVGVIPFTLAMFSLFKRDSKVFFFAAMAILTLILALKTPLSPFLVSLKIPVISTSAFSRIIVLFSFALVVLSGLGFDHLIRKIREIRAAKEIVVVLVLIGVVFVSIWLLLFFSNIYPEGWLIVAKRNFVLPTALFFSGAGLLFLGMRYKKLMLLVTCYLLLVTIFDSFRFAQKWMPFDPKELVYPEVPIIDAMKKNIDNGRIFGNLGAEVTNYYHLPSIEGYDPLYIGRYGEFIRSAGNGQFTKGERSLVKLSRRGKYTDRVLDLLGVSLVFQPIADTNQGWAYPVWQDKKRYTLAYQDNKFELYKNNLAMPRALLFYDFEVVGEDKEIIKRFYSDEFDFRKILILEEDPQIELEKEASGSAQIVSYTQNKIIITAETKTPALLFLSDNFYPGWKAKVNGHEEKIYRADYTFRAVKVPAGKSNVEFNYENWPF